MGDGNKTLVDPNDRNQPTWLDYLRLGSGAASGYANAQAQSRAAQTEAQLAREALRQSGERGYNDAIAQREKDRQDSAASAYKRLIGYDVINQGGVHTPMVSPYSRPAQGPGDNAKRLATDEGIVNELHQRASFGDPYFPGAPGLSDTNIGRLRVPGSDNPGDVYSKLMVPSAGLGEKAAGVTGTVLPLLGAAKEGHWYDWLKHLFGGGGNGGSGGGSSSGSTALPRDQNINDPEPFDPNTPAGAAAYDTIFRERRPPYPHNT